MNLLLKVYIIIFPILSNFFFFFKNIIYSYFLLYCIINSLFMITNYFLHYFDIFSLISISGFKSSTLNEIISIKNYCLFFTK